MNTNKQIAAAFQTLLAFIFLASQNAIAEEAPKIGKETLIHITKELRFLNGFYHYEFSLPINQAERFRFSLKPVHGAKMKTQVVIYRSGPKGKRKIQFEQSEIAPSQDWSMSEKPPGDEIGVRIRVNSLGDLNLTVNRVENGPSE